MIRPLMIHHNFRRLGGFVWTRDRSLLWGFRYIESAQQTTPTFLPPQFPAFRGFRLDARPPAPSMEVSGGFFGREGIFGVDRSDLG